MDTFDSYRSTVPARLPGLRPGTSALRTTAGTPAASPPSPLSVQVVLRGARRYWWLVLMLWLVGSAAVGAAVYLNVKPTYRAASLLRVDPVISDLYGVRGTGEQHEVFMGTQVQLISSPSVLSVAALNPAVASLPRIRSALDPEQELRKVVVVGGVPGTYLLEVSMTSSDPHETAVIVNAVVDAFLDANENWSDGKTKAQIKNLENYKHDLEVQTKEAEDHWKELVKRGDLDNFVIQEANKEAKEGPAGLDPKAGQNTARSSITIEQYKSVKHQLFSVDLELAEAQAQLDSAKAALEMVGKKTRPAVDDELLNQEIEKRFRMDPEVRSHAAQMRQAENKYAEIRRIARKGGDASEGAVRRKLADLGEQYNQLWEAKSLAIREEIASGGRKLDPGQEVREAEAIVRRLVTRQSSLRQRMTVLDVDNKQQATDQVELTLTIDERGNLRQMQEAIRRRLEQLKFEAKSVNRVQKIDPAKLPGIPIADKRVTYLAMTPVGILGTVLCLVVLLEIRAGRVADPEVLSHRIKHEVFSIAPLPDLRPGDDAGSDRSEQRLARFVQSLDHLRVALCEGGIPGEGRCVMITSATGGEGKTTLSAHLAARCANSGTTTLLIDADLRRASLGRLLDVPVGPGLGDVLAGDVDLDEALITVQAGGFHFLSAGTPGRDPSRVLKSTRLSELIDRLRRTYDLVIIDTPPVLPVADALIMGRWADGAVMAARFDASRLPLVERANRQLALAGIPVLGVVVNGVKGQDSTYGNYAYNYNYYPARDDHSAEAPTS